MSGHSVKWSEIQANLGALISTEGGFTLAQRGLLTLSDGRELFTKIGVDEETERWAKKEIAVYHFLRRHSYPFIPEFLTSNNDETGFALEAVSVAEDGIGRLRGRRRG